MLRLADCADREDVGPKARRLAHALRAGLPVPDGWVVLPDEEPRELEAALTALFPRSATVESDPYSLAGPGPQATEAEPRFAVRSSAAFEDGALRSAAGLFSSIVGVRKADVPAAIAAVKRSADGDAVRSYLDSDAAAAVRMAVLIQPMVAAVALGVLYLRPDGTGTCEERSPGTPEWADASVLPLQPESDPALHHGAQALAELVAREAETATGSFAHERPPVYIEYARTKTGIVFLQVRPAPAAAPPEPWPTPPAELADEALLFDAEHNPDPLSSAQAGLVDCVADLSPRLRQWVCRRYLYYAQLLGTGTANKDLPIQSLHARFQDEIRPQCEALLGPLEARLVAKDGALRPELLVEPQRATIAVAEALHVYRGVYERYVEKLGPALRKARQHLDQLLRQNLGESLNAHGALLAGATAAEVERLQALYELGESLPRSADPSTFSVENAQGCPKLRTYLSRYGAYARCWDVSVPCDDEQVVSLLQTAARLYAAGASPRAQHETAQAPYHLALAALLDRLPRMARGALKALLPTVRSALSIAEDDDLLFFRAQRVTRWALLSLGGKLVESGRIASADQIFELPLSLVQALDGNAQAATDLDLTQIAEEGIRERSAARVLVPPSRWRSGHPLWPVADSMTLRGCGIPGPDPAPVRGRATVIRSLDTPPAATESAEVLVLPALIPSWAATLWHARALVTDSGGALAHGALLARERGIPAVVGTRTATRSIRDGQLVWVDAQRGRVHVF